LQSKEKLSI